MRHRVIRPVVLGLVAAFLLAVGAAAAKMPYFSVEVSPPDPVDGDVVTIVVRMWDDARHTQPATWGPESPIEGLLEFRGDAGNLPITLVRVDESSYAAEVTLPEGTWRMIPFPRPGAGIVVDAGTDGYPAPMTLTVASRTAGATAAAIAALGALGIAGVGLLIGGPVRRRLRRQRSSAVTR